MPVKRLAALLPALALIAACAGCAGTDPAESGKLHVVATTYPVYALAAAVSAGAEGIDLSRLNTGQVSCLHDYTLTVADARRLEQADLLLLNGAGLEDFLDEMLTQLDAPEVDCSATVPLLEPDESEHDHGGEEDEADPHYWMDPRAAAQMALAIAGGLSEVDPNRGDLYQDNAQAVSKALLQAYEDWSGALQGLSCPYLITFHDGFRYFADAFGLELLFAMEEEEGATASAKDIRTAALYVEEYDLPAVFMEENGSGSAARAVSGETGAAVCTLSMLMDGPDAPSDGGAEEILSALYLDAMGENIETLSEVLG